MEMQIQDVLISGADDFLAKYLYRAVSDKTGATGSMDAPRVWMLGTGETAGIRADITVERVNLPEKMQVVIHCDGTDMDAGGVDEDGAVARVANLTASLQDGLPGVMIYISSVAVYGLRTGVNINESTPVAPDSSYGRAKLAAEKFLERWCDDNDVVLYILRPAMVVGTGMGGALRRLVNRIYRCTYRHVDGNDARVSVVHASTLAGIAATVMSLPGGGIYNVTDGADPTRHDLAEALAWRLDHKRIYTVSLSKARVLARVGDYLPVTMFTTASLGQELSTLTFDGRAILELTGMEPQPVTDYLCNHVYDESSL